jgi:arylsulfatase A-like enzyme
MPAGQRTVIVFTSDHGEAFREHGQLGHTVSVYDEELHVPGWIDAPAGTLDDAERHGLETAADELVFHADLAATILDLLRVWDAPELLRFRARMAGVSLLRANDVRARESGAAPMPLTNCTDLWGCAFRNWGLMRGSRKLEAREWDTDWHCWDVRADPAERRDLGRAGCGDLADAALRLYGSTPRDSAPIPERD